MAETIQEIKRISKIAEFLNISEDSVENLSNKEIAEKMFIKLIKEGYVIEKSNEGTGFSFYKDY